MRQKYPKTKPLAVQFEKKKELTFQIKKIEKVSHLRYSLPKLANLGEEGIVARNRLNQSAQVGSRDSKNERPIFGRIQVDIGENEETFVAGRLQLIPHNDLEETLCVHLLSSCVNARSRFNHPLFL